MAMALVFCIGMVVTLFRCVFSGEANPEPSPSPSGGVELGNPVCVRGVCADLPKCSAGVPLAERWRDDFDSSDRLIYIERYHCADPTTCYDNSLVNSMSAHMRCIVKGPGGRGSIGMKEYVDVNIQSSGAEFHTKKPCGFSEIPLELSAAASNATCVDLSGTSQLDDRCPYPTLPANQTLVRPAPSSWPDDLKWAWAHQHSYLGPVFRFGAVNGEHFDGPSFGSTEQFNETLISGLDTPTFTPSACDDTDVRSRGNPDATAAYYDGGVQMVMKRGSYLTRRAYMFKNDNQRDAARSAQGNEGLQYAHLVQGMHGCDVEMVFEIIPKSGGGIDLSFSFPLFAYTWEQQRQLRDSAAVYINTMTQSVHLLVKKQALQTAQNLPCADDAEGYEEMSSFALTFVCGSTGDRVTGTMFMLLANGSRVAAASISEDSANPTHWNARDAFTNLDLDNGDSPTFNFQLSASQAPESCGVMFFDPLFSAVAGDGIDYVASTGPGRTVSEEKVPETEQTRTVASTSTAEMIPRTETSASTIAITTSASSIGPTLSSSTFSTSVAKTTEMVTLDVIFGDLDAFATLDALQSTMRDAMANTIDAAGDDVVVIVESIVVRVSYAFANNFGSSQVRQAIADANGIAVSQVTLLEGLRRLGSFRSSDAGRRLTTNVDAEIAVIASNGEDLLVQASKLHKSANDMTALASSLENIVGGSISVPAVASPPKLSVKFQTSVVIDASENGGALITSDFAAKLGNAVGGNVTSAVLATPSTTDSSLDTSIEEESCAVTVTLIPFLTSLVLFSVFQ